MRYTECLEIQFIDTKQKAASPLAYSPRKRPRYSSSTDDFDLPEPSRDELAACDEIEAKLSQNDSSLLATNNDAVVVQSDHDHDNPFLTSAKATFGFMSATGVALRDSSNPSRSPSPEIPTEADYSSWFEPTEETSIAPVEFSTASFALGFKTASNRGLVPSKAALLKAQEKMKDILTEGRQEGTSVAPLSAIGIGGFHAVPLPKLEARRTLKSMEDSVVFNIPRTPLRGGLKSALHNYDDTPSRIPSELKGKTRASGLPLFPNQEANSSHSILRNSSIPFLTASTMTSMVPVSQAVKITTPKTATRLSFQSPLLSGSRLVIAPIQPSAARTLGLTPQRKQHLRIGTTPAPFTPPFKKHALQVVSTFKTPTTTAPTSLVVKHTDLLKLSTKSDYPSFFDFCKPHIFI